MTLEQSVREAASLLAPAVKEAENKASRDVFGTAMVSSSGAYVMLDGAAEPVRCSFSVNCIDGDRVVAHIVNHRVVVFSNLTNPDMSAAEVISHVRENPYTGIVQNVVISDSTLNDIELHGFLATDGTIENTKISGGSIDGATLTNIPYAAIDGLDAHSADIADARIGQATITQAQVENLVSDKAEINGKLTAAEGDITNLKAKDVTIEGNITAATGRIGALESDNVTVKGRLDAAEADIGDLEAEDARITNLVAGKASITDLNAATGRITTLESTKANIADIEANYITAANIEATYMHANMSNSDVAWISNGVIANGAISSAMINDVSANKLTAGTINGSVINVTNLTADNITAGTLNGQRIGAGSLSLDKLSEDVYTEAEVDAMLDTMQSEIDGAIETWTGTSVPTLNNAPASAWTTASDRDKHVGDVYFNTTSGYNYRFTKSGTGSSATYSWLQIKDTDITNALQRIQTAEGQITQFDSDISTLKTDTGELKTKTQSLETSLGDKVDTTTFNELEDTVDGHTQTISQHTTAISNKADSSTVTAVTNRVSKNEQDISGINTTIGELQTTVASKADGSTVETISSKLNTVSDTVDGHTQTISSVQGTAENANNKAVAYSATSSTGASTAAKVAACTNFPALAAGVTVTVRFSVANTSTGALTLNVNSTGAKTVYVNGSATASTNQLLWAANANITFTYDGTYWRVDSEPRSWYGTCSIAAGTAAKSAVINEAVICKGTNVTLNMTSENTNASATLNITSTGAKNIYYGTTTTRPTTSNGYGWTAASTVTFVFDGAYWRLGDTSALAGLASVKSTVTEHSTSIQQNAEAIQLKANSSDVDSLTGRVSTAESTITQHSSAIEAKVSKDGVIAAINLSTEQSGGSAAKIQASKVEIDGTAIFSAISDDVDDAITDKGYQTSSQVESAITSKGYATTGQAQGYANTAEQNAKAAIPTDISDLNNDTGFITSDDVPTKVSELTNDSGFQTSSQVDTAITSKGYQTASQVSTAISTGTANLAAKSDAVKRTQRIYYRSNSATTPGTPGTASSNWVTKADDGNSAWTRMHVAITSTYKYIYTCEQYELASGTVGYTSVLRDNTITVIDGGNIITGSVAANKLDVYDATIGKISAGAIDTASITIGQSQVTNLTSALAGKADNSDIPTAVSQLTNDSSYATTTQVGTAKSEAISAAASDATTKANNAAQTATNYIAADSTGIRIANANPSTATTYQHQTSTATEFVAGGERTAQFGGNGATIGKDDELQLKMTAGKMALENDTDDEVFSVTENAGTIISRTADLVTFASASDVSTTTYSVSDSLATADAPTVTFEISGDIYTLDSTYATATATAGTGVSVALTSDGVDFITGLFEDAEGSGVLAVDYHVSHYDQAVLDMDGSMTIDGEGDIVKVVNTGWAAADGSDTFFIARNEVTGKELRIGVGAGGYNRGIYDAGGSRWLVYADKNNVSNANLDNVYGRGKRSVRIGAAAPSAFYYFGKFRTYDAKGDVVFYSDSAYTTAKDLYRSFVCRRFSSNGKTKYDNGFYLHVDNSGNPSVSFTSGGAAAWRNGLGASSGVWPVSLGGTGSTSVTSNSTISDIVSAASNISITSASVQKWGRVLMLGVAYTVNKDISVPASGNVSDVSIGTVKAAYRPHNSARLVSTNYGSRLELSSGGALSIVSMEARGAAYTASSGFSDTARGIYLLAD